MLTKIASLFLVLGNALISIDNNNRLIKDEYGRHTIFHGVNVVYKIPPYIPDVDKFEAQDSLSEKDIDDLVSWGMNFVRLGVMWEAVETAPGVYNETYIKQVNDLITRMGKKGIYTLVDAHQDVLSREVCGEGMPNFYADEILKGGSYCFGSWSDYLIAPIAKLFGACKSIKEYNYETDENGYPLISECQKESFFIYYTTPEAWTLFRAIYHNDLGMQDKYVAYWAFVAKNLSPNPYVVGFDPFNEPLPAFSGVNTVPSLLWPGNFDKTQLNPMYERIYNEAYKPADSKSIMYFEPGQFPDVLPFFSRGIVQNVGFEKPPGEEIGSQYHLLNDHDYCCQLSPDICAKTGEPEPETA